MTAQLSPEAAHSGIQQLHAQIAQHFFTGEIEKEITARNELCDLIASHQKTTRNLASSNREGVPGSRQMGKRPGPAAPRQGNSVTRTILYGNIVESADDGHGDEASTSKVRARSASWEEIAYGGVGITVSIVGRF